jgi:transcriptional regulator with XRE-family HTH domain
MARIKKEIADAYNMPFPVALRTLMGEKSTTQENIAKVTGKTRQTVSQYVNGISEPSYETLIKIADFFNVSVDYLLGRTKDRRRDPTIYDKIGLSEESITILRIAQEAEDGVIDHAKLLRCLPDKSAFTDATNTDPLSSEAMQTFWQILVSSACCNLRKYLPEFIDRVIEVAIDSPVVIENFSQIVNPDQRPSGLNKVMTQDEFVRFKVFEITNYLNTRLLEWFSDYRED